MQLRILEPHATLQLRLYRNSHIYIYIYACMPPSSYQIMVTFLNYLSNASMSLYFVSGQG